jgi:imidazolonepropionase-like amidohydrolase
MTFIIHANSAEARTEAIAAGADVLAFHAAGGTIILGTDTPAQDGVGNPPGLNTLREIESLAESGIPAAAIFCAATLGNAQAFRLDGEIGTVAPGLQADLLLLGANPLKSVAAYDQIEMVILDGVAIPRDELATPR